MRIHPAPQGSGEWLVARASYLTASVFDKVLTPAKLQLSTSKDSNAVVNLCAVARVFGVIDEGAETFAMRRGTDMEAEARAWYAFEYGVTVEEVGLCISDDESCGASPDGLIGEDGGLEIKCPGLKQHIENLLFTDFPNEYLLQVQGGLYVTGRKWWDWVSYHPGLPKRVVRHYPDPKVHAALDLAMESFKERVEAAVERLEAIKNA